MPFASRQRNRDYMRAYMARIRAKLPKKAHVKRALTDSGTDGAQVHCAHCGRYVLLKEWGNFPHIPEVQLPVQAS